VSTVSKDDDKILAEALKRFERSAGYWSNIRQGCLLDMKFSLGDCENEWQWPQWALAQRKDDRRPVLTINRMSAHIAQVCNEVRQNPPQSKVRPVDDNADIETAKIFSGLIRHIWNNGDAVYAITNASEWQVAGGYGYFRVLTDYVDDGSLEQEIYVKAIVDPTTVYDDPAIQTPTGSDRQFCFVVEDMPRAEFKEQYPDAQEVDFSSAGGNQWWQEDSVRVAEYWTIKRKPRTLNMYADGSTGYADEDDGLLPVIKSRNVDVPYVCWYKITGSEILDKREMPQRYIPIVRVVGVEKIIDGEREVKGLTRNAKDAQRMYNFWATSYAERVALAPLAPFIGPQGFAENFETKWGAANRKSFAYLEYNVVHDDQGTPLPPPQRQPGPDVPAGYVQGMMLSSDDIKATTGQFDASLGAQSNETSGRAIMARQRESDTGTYHYLDNLTKAVEFAGKIIVDLAPKVYDTQRVLRILGEDGTEGFAQVDPNLEGAMAETRDMAGKVKNIYNLGVGRYDLSVSTGPTYTTKRAESADFFTSLTQSDPTLMQKAGDIIVRNFDLPGADELAERLKLFLPPEIRQAEEQEEGQQMPPQIMAAVKQIEQANQMLDAKAQEMAQMQQQMEAEKGAVDGKKQELQNMADRISAEMRELELRKQVAIRDIKLAEANLRNAETTARAQVDEYVQTVTGAAINQDAEYGA
jgi:hypothetical protein